MWKIHFIRPSQIINVSPKYHCPYAEFFTILCFNIVNKEGDFWGLRSVLDGDWRGSFTSQHIYENLIIDTFAVY